MKNENQIHGPHLTARFGDDPETLKKIQHIADWYNGFDVPQYDGEDSSGHITAFDGTDTPWLVGDLWSANACKIIKPAFSTMQGQITDEMCRIGNPMGGRLWGVYTDSASEKPWLLACIMAGTVLLARPNEVWNIGSPETIRLATPEELQANNIDPREAGVKESYAETV